MTMSLTNTEFVTGIVTLLAVGIGAALVLVGVAIAWLILDYREDHRYEARHDGTLTWPALLPAPRTPWDRPHPGWDVYPLTAAEMQVLALLWAVQRAELLYAVPQLQPSWIADTAALCAREAGLLGGRGAGLADLVSAQRVGVRAPAPVESSDCGECRDLDGASRSDGTSRHATATGGLLAAGTSRESR